MYETLPQYISEGVTRFECSRNTFAHIANHAGFHSPHVNTQAEALKELTEGVLHQMDHELTFVFNDAFPDGEVAPDPGIVHDKPKEEHLTLKHERWVNVKTPCL